MRARGPEPGRGRERERPARAWRVSDWQSRPRGAGGRRAGPGGGAGGRTSGGACGWGPKARGDLWAEGHGPPRGGTGRRVEARPAAGLGDLPWRRPLALDPASAGRVGTRPPPKLARLGSWTCAGHAVASGMSSCDDRGPAPPALHALSGPRPEKLAPGTVCACQHLPGGMGG